MNAQSKSIAPDDWLRSQKTADIRKREFLLACLNVLYFKALMAVTAQKQREDGTQIF
jgi:hypothetical protein